MEPVRIGMVAGEASGDQLGADLIPALRAHFPDAEFEGIGGERMTATGFHSLFPQERLAVMGFVEPLKRLPELLRIRRALRDHFLHQHFDLVLGIDAPDFNLGLERQLRRQGRLTAHYVSPSVWAWRRGRVRKIARAVDRMLCLFPFESDFYRDQGVPVSFVGHPLADRIPRQVDAAGARRELGLPDGPLLAILPGSRGSEIALMADLFLDVAERLVAQDSSLGLIIPAAGPARYAELRDKLAARPHLDVTLIEGDSHRAMSAADAVLLTSGTTALEAMLLKKPMVVAYRMGPASWWLASKLVKTPWISLPNLVAKRTLVPELLQDEASVERLARESARMLYDDTHRAELIATFTELHEALGQGASERAAQVLADMIRDCREHSGGEDRIAVR